MREAENIRGAKHSQIAITNRVWRFALGGMFAAFLCAGNARADSMLPITSRGAQASNDSVDWSQLGADATVLESSANMQSAEGRTVNLSLAGPNSIVAAVCPVAQACSWTGSGFTTGDSLLWTSDSGNGGNGPATLVFATPVSGVGALIEADGPGLFTAQIQVYDGLTSLGSFPVTSDTIGDATYIGVKDQTAANITSAVFSLTSCAGNCADFAIDTVYLNTLGGTPVPTVTPTSTATPVPTATPSPTATPTSPPTPTPANAALIATPRRLVLKRVLRQIVLLNRRTHKHDQAITITSIVSSSSEFRPDGACVGVIAPGARCVFSVTFIPSPSGSHRGTLTISSNANDPVIGLDLIGRLK
jgi:hypothetical protein